MSSKPPPVPPANRSIKGVANAAAAPRDETRHGRPPVENTAEQGQQGNINQNTRNQGHQQDR